MPVNPTQSDLPQDASLHLWRLIIDYEGKTFQTTGRGSNPGVEFTYEVSRTPTPAAPTTVPHPSTVTKRERGRKYAGQSIEGYGNELWIITLPDGIRKKKSISRSTVDLAYRNALEEQEKSGFVSGPRKLGVPGVRSNLYSMFLRFGVIQGDPDSGTAVKDGKESKSLEASAAMDENNRYLLS